MASSLLSRVLKGTSSLYLLFACSGSAPNGPIAATDLDGTWCAQDGLCLTADVATLRYQWAGDGCNETGKLSGALEFTPDVGSNVCFGYSDLYSAEGEWTADGIRLAIDIPRLDATGGVVGYRESVLALQYPNS